MLWQWCSWPPTRSGLRLWPSIGKSYIHSARTVWTELPIKMKCQCRLTRFLRCKWDGSIGAGNIFILVNLSWNLRRADSTYPVMVMRTFMLM